MMHEMRQIQETHSSTAVIYSLPILIALQGEQPQSSQFPYRSRSLIGLPEYSRGPVNKVFPAVRMLKSRCLL
jgi:hypothetical protein